jgi:hypothetical protein
MKSTKKTTSKPELLYCCPDNIVRVLRQREGLRRDPPHKYPCVLFLLRPCPGTRVRIDDNGRIEFMAKFDEVRAWMDGIDPNLAAKLPATMRNKPRERELKWRAINAKKFSSK